MRAALYARYSTGNQSPLSIEDQLRLARGLAAAEGAHVVREFDDAELSGFTSDARPGLNALLDFVRAGGCDMVIAEHSDRLARDGEKGWQVFNLFRAARVRYLTVQEGEVTILHQGVSSLVSELKGEEARVRTRRGLEGVVRAGRSPGRPPFGYRIPLVYDAAGERVRGLLEVEPAAADLVVRIFEDYAAGLSPLAIAAALNAEGRTGPTGGRWNASTIHGDPKLKRGVLHNELYRGQRVWGRHTTLKDRRTGKRRAVAGQPGQEAARVAVESLRIVSEPLWASAQARMAHQAVGPQGQNNGARRPKTLLAGLIRCQACGGAMTRGGSGDHLRCGTRAQQGPAACGNTRTPSYADVERRVLASLQANLLHPDMVAEAVAGFQAAQADRHRAQARAEGQLRRDMEEAERRAARLIAEVENGMPWSAAAPRHADLTARAAQLRGQMEAIARGAEVVTLHPAAAGLYRDLVANLGDLLADPGRDGADAREALRGLVQAVVFKPGQARGAYDLDILAELAPLLGQAAPGDRLVPATNSRSRFKRSHDCETTVRLTG
jgi:site-specific DNA recombinase